MSRALGLRPFWAVPLVEGCQSTATNRGWRLVAATFDEGLTLAGAEGPVSLLVAPWRQLYEAVRLRGPVSGLDNSEVN